MEGKNGLDILPLPLFWSNPSTTLFSGARYHMIDNAVPLGFSQWLACQGVLSFIVRLSCSDAIQPVFDSVIKCQCQGISNGTLRNLPRSVDRSVQVLV